MSANSTAAAFLESLDENHDHPAFTDVRQHPATETLREWGTGNPPLGVVAEYLDQLGSALERIVSAHEQCAVLKGATVEHLAVHSGVGVTVQTRDTSGELRSIQAKRAIVATGGQPATSAAQLEILKGLSLAEYQGKVQHASAIIDTRLGVDPQLIETVKQTGQAVILGNAHSAWSAARLLLDTPAFRDVNGQPPHVTLIHRSPVRLFYLSTSDAEADGYAFDPTRDVCHLSGRVNRCGGVKGDARALALRVLRQGDDPPPITMLQVTDTKSFRTAAARTLQQAGLILMATGYRARLPQISIDEYSFEPALSETGRILTKSGQLVSSDGRVIDELLAYGLGTSIREAIGGEPSAGDRLTSVWLYQHDIADIVLQTLLGEADAVRHAAPPLSAGARR